MKKRRKKKKGRKTSTVPKVNLTNPFEGLLNGEEIALDLLAKPECKEVRDELFSIMGLDESELAERIKEWLQDNDANTTLVAEHFKDCEDGFDCNDESFISDMTHQIKNLNLTEFNDADKLATHILFLLLDKEYVEMYAGDELWKKRIASMKLSSAFVIIGTSWQIREIVKNTPPDKLMHTYFLHRLYFLGYHLGMLDMTNIMYPGSIDIGGSAYH